MASLSTPTPNLTACAAYCATDPVLGHILVFYHPHPPSTPVPRIEAHVLTCAGFQSYPKLTLAQSSPLYAAVNHLPLQKQSSDVHRGLSIAILKYFSDLSKAVKETILRSKNNVSPTGEGQAVAFDEMHAGDLAARLKEIESESLLSDLTCALPEKFVTSIDLDIVMRHEGKEIDPDSIPDLVERFLKYFGESTYLPFTKLKRSASRPAAVRPKNLKDTAEALSRELEELRDTEENYVTKLRELNEDVVKPLKQRSKVRKNEFGGLGGKDLDTLFPPCLETIIEVNTRFLAAIKEGEIEDVSQYCLKMFPAFEKPYKEYIRRSAEFPQLLSKCMKNRDSSFSKKIQQTGEQKLRSLIIEPVQRLPRYSLLIDNMINLLPSDHPSFEPLNEARSIVTDICSLQHSETDERSITVRRLQQIIPSWPSSLHPAGRLITGIDFEDILPPYNENTSEYIPSILLLFPDCVVILRRPKSTSLMARGVMAAIDKPGGGDSNFGSGSKREGPGNDLQFAGWIDISYVKLASSESSRVVWMSLESTLKDGWDVRTGGSGQRKLRLLNQYEGRAHKVEEEFAKARLERRTASNQKGIVGIRETKYEGLTLWSCVWNPSRYTREREKGSIVLYINTAPNMNRSFAGKELVNEVGRDGVDIAFCLEETRGKQMRLECRSWNDYSSTDTIPHDDVFSVFTMRLSSLLRLHASLQHPPLTTTLISANRKLLRSFGIPFEGEGRFSKLRPPSPVKLFSSILTPGSPSRTRPGPNDRTQNQTTPQKERAIPMQRGATVLGINNERDLEDDDSIHRITMASESPLRRIEATFEAFISIIKTIDKKALDLSPLHELQKVDNDAVDFLLTQLVTNPKAERLGQDMRVDVVLSALNRFLNREWKASMGAIVSQKSLEELQQKSEMLYPGDFEDFFKISVLDWAPQNKRAFKAAIGLLRDMQGTVEAEDDKGLLTKVFTELLVGEEVNPLDYMGLVDLLVEEYQTLFNEGAIENGTVSVKRAKSVNNGSLAAGTSLRKRFGLSHTSSMREGSKNLTGSDQKSHSVWRSLSKKEKGHIGRSKSIDYGAQRQPAAPGTPQKDRPTSSDRPSLYGGSVNASASSLEAPSTPSKVGTVRPLSTFLASPIVLNPTLRAEGVPRRKRRSSLSDLTDHPDFVQLNAPQTATPASQSSMSLDISEPARRPPTPSDRLLSLLPPPRTGSVNSTRSERSARSEMSDWNEVSSSVPKREVPIRKPIGSAPSQPGTQRLKMQSPQKLRERLQTEKQALTSVEASLQREIDMIGAELTNAIKTSSPSLRRTDKLRDLSYRVNLIEDKFSKLEPHPDAAAMAELEKVQKQLGRKEQELGGVEKLLDDCITENDVMFEKFNEELVKLSNGFKAGKGDSRALKILQEVRADQGRLKRENMRLRREIVGLRTYVGRSEVVDTTPPSTARDAYDS